MDVDEALDKVEVMMDASELCSLVALLRLYLFTSSQL